MGYGPFGDIAEDVRGTLDPLDATGQQQNKEAQDALNERYKQMHANFQAYRPEHANSRMNALNQQLGAFGPINDLIQRMYGQGSGIDLAALGQNPMTQGSMLAGSGNVQVSDKAPLEGGIEDAFKYFVDTQPMSSGPSTEKVVYGRAGQPASRAVGPAAPRRFTSGQR